MTTIISNCIGRILLLFQMGFSDSDGKPGSFAEQYTLRREIHLTSLQQKEEEMRQKFVIRVKEKEGELKESEREVLCTFQVNLDLSSEHYSKWDPQLLPSFLSNIISPLSDAMICGKMFIQWTTARFDLPPECSA